MSEARGNVAAAVAEYLLQQGRTEKAFRLELGALASWSAVLDVAAGPSEHERAMRGAWLSSRKVRQQEEEKLRAVDGRVDEAFAAWDREGPSA